MRSATATWWWRSTFPASDASAPCATGGSAGSAAGGTGGGAGAAGAAGSASDLSFALELDHSGASHLENELALPGGNVSASLRFRGETATLQDWPSDQGALLIKSAATPVAQLEAPFTDGTRAVGFTSTETTYIAQSAEPGEVAQIFGAPARAARHDDGGVLAGRAEPGDGGGQVVESRGVHVPTLPAHAMMPE